MWHICLSSGSDREGGKAWFHFFCLVFCCHLGPDGSKKKEKKEKRRRHETLSFLMKMLLRSPSSLVSCLMASRFPFPSNQSSCFLHPTNCQIYPPETWMMKVCLIIFSSWIAVCYNNYQRVKWSKGGGSRAGCCPEPLNENVIQSAS